MVLKTLPNISSGEPIVADTAVAALRDKMRGLVMRADDEGYEEARVIYNGMIDRYPT